MKLIVRFGVWLRQKRNACLYGAVAYGIPMWGFFVWLTWDTLHPLGWLIFVGVIALSSGVAWGWAMWHIMSRRSNDRKDIDVDPN